CPGLIPGLLGLVAPNRGRARRSSPGPAPDPTDHQPRTQFQGSGAPARLAQPFALTSKSRVTLAASSGTAASNSFFTTSFFGSAPPPFFTVACEACPNLSIMGSFLNSAGTLAVAGSSTAGVTVTLYLPGATPVRPLNFSR